jgi:hypothetical protein
MYLNSARDPVKETPILRAMTCFKSTGKCADDGSIVAVSKERLLSGTCAFVDAKAALAATKMPTTKATPERFRTLLPQLLYADQSSPLVNLPKYGVMIIQLAPVTGIGALKARSIVAWGNAPGAEQPRIRRAEGPR